MGRRQIRASRACGEEKVQGLVPLGEMEGALEAMLVVGSIELRCARKNGESAWHLRWRKRGSTALMEKFLRQNSVLGQLTRR